MPLNRTNAVRLEQKLDERDKVMSHTVECILIAHGLGTLERS